MKRIFAPIALSTLMLLSGCGDDDVPAAENEEEVINEVTLSFAPAAGGTTLNFTYLDPDGEGTQPATKDEIVLDANTIYLLTVTLKNTVDGNNEDISAEVTSEGDEHQIFYSWTGSLFTTPKGLGNIGASGNISYQDFDADLLPVGLETAWETASPANGTFRLLLKHQPGVKTSTSTSEDGETDVDITWVISVQ